MDLCRMTTTTWLILPPNERQQLHRTLKNLALKLKDFKISGQPPICIFDFLGRLVEEADTLDMNEGRRIVFFRTCCPRPLHVIIVQAQVKIIPMGFHNCLNPCNIFFALTQPTTRFTRKRKTLSKFVKMQANGRSCMLLVFEKQHIVAETYT